MPTAKEQMEEIVRKQPDDATYEEILRELAFEKMVQNGLTDSRSGQVTLNADMKAKIAQWRK